MLKSSFWLCILLGAVLGWLLGLVTALPIGWGLLGGGAIGGLVGWYAIRPKAALNDTAHPYESCGTLKLREEELEITKRTVPTGKVNLHTEVVTEEKQISVPVSREDLIIEKTVLFSDAPDYAEPVVEVVETIRIPISEERVEISKRPVMLEDVTVYQRQFQTIESVAEKVKKEQLKVETTGDAKVSNEENE